MLLEGAVVAEQAKSKVAEGHPDAAFYAGKIQAALYFARNVLPGVEHKAAAPRATRTSRALDIPDAGFATV